MSQENVEIVRAGFAAFDSGDVDAWLELYDPAVEFKTLLLGVRRGREELRAALAENRKDISRWRLVPEELIDSGNQVIAVVRLGGAGRVSQIGLDDRIAFLVTLRDGRVVRQETFRSKAEALEAAGPGE